MLEFTEYTKFLVALIAVANPIGLIPIYISLTAQYNSEQRNKIGRLVVISAVIILLVAAFFGELILAFFGISIHSFQVGGGILILLMAIGMLRDTSKNLQQNQAMADQSGESIAVVPLAMPLLAGPGAISTVIINAAKDNGVYHYLFLSLDILILGVILWALLKLVPWISQRIGIVGTHITTRIMGLILAAIAIEFITSGLKGLFPPLAG